MRHDLGFAVRETIGLGLGMFPLGVTFGLLVVQSGLAWWWTPLFSCLIYAGSLEFLLVGLVSVATPLASIALTALLVNGRHVFYCLSFPLHRVSGRFAKVYSMYALIDEAYALMAARPAASLTSRRIVFVQLSLQSYWVIGGLTGAATGRVLPGAIDGLDFALVALFAVLAIEAGSGRGDLGNAWLAVGCGLAALLITPGQALLVALCLYVAGLLIGNSAAVRRVGEHA